MIAYIGNCLRCTFKDDTLFIDLYSADVKWQLKMGFLLRQACAREGEIKMHFVEV